MANEEIVSRIELARRLGFSIEKIRRLVERGMPYRRRGQGATGPGTSPVEWEFEIGEVMTWLEAEGISAEFLDLLPQDDPRFKKVAVRVQRRRVTLTELRANVISTKDAKAYLTSRRNSVVYALEKMPSEIAPIIALSFDVGEKNIRKALDAEFVPVLKIAGEIVEILPTPKPLPSGEVLEDEDAPAESKRLSPADIRYQDQAIQGEIDEIRLWLDTGNAVKVDDIVFRIQDVIARLSSSLRWMPAQVLNHLRLENVTMAAQMKQALDSEIRKRQAYIAEHIESLPESAFDEPEPANA
ncbi:MAG TPA: hypothetical protein VNQ34_07210 [Xanthobacteraceae bacterium]|nr:hypothetical protein [Xanthobacteraceae bacterium]